MNANKKPTPKPRQKAKSLRDEIAFAAMNGVLSSLKLTDQYGNFYGLLDELPGAVAITSYEMADAMLRARSA